MDVWPSLQVCYVLFFFHAMFFLLPPLDNERILKGDWEKLQIWGELPCWWEPERHLKALPLGYWWESSRGFRPQSRRAVNDVQLRCTARSFTAAVNAAGKHYCTHCNDQKPLNTRLPYGGGPNSPRLASAGNVFFSPSSTHSCDWMIPAQSKQSGRCHLAFQQKFCNVAKVTKPAERLSTSRDGGEMKINIRNRCWSRCNNAASATDRSPPQGVKGSAPASQPAGPISI